MSFFNLFILLLTFAPNSEAQISSDPCSVSFEERCEKPLDDFRQEMQKTLDSYKSLKPHLLGDIESFLSNGAPHMLTCVTKIFPILEGASCSTEEGTQQCLKEVSKNFYNVSQGGPHLFEMTKDKEYFSRLSKKDSCYSVYSQVKRKSLQVEATLRTMAYLPEPEPDRRKKIREIFGLAKESIEESLEKMRLPHTTKVRLKRKIRKQTLAPCFGQTAKTVQQHIGAHSFDCGYTGYAAPLDSVLICGYLNNPKYSIDGLLPVILHELAHSIDACAAPSAWNEGKGEGFSKVQTCLKSKKSLGARSRPGNFFERISRFIQKGQLRNCRTDSQIGEGTADWLAAESLPGLVGKWTQSPSGESDEKRVLERAIEGFCMPSNPTRSFGEHPATRSRIDKVFLAHPGIRNKLGCGSLDPKKVKYCSSEFPVTTGGIHDPYEQYETGR